MALVGPSKGDSRNIFVTVEIEIGRPPGMVWPYLVDWERLDRWMLEARDFRVTSDRREGVGTEAEATVRIALFRTRDRVRVTVWNPPWALEITHLGRVKGTGYLELSPTEAGTRVFWREELVPPWGPVGRIGLALLRPAMRRAFRRDLEALRVLVETGR